MSGEALDERTRVGSGLEVVIDSTVGTADLHPAYGYALDLLSTLNEVIRAVRIAQQIKERVGALEELPVEVDTFSREVIELLELMVYRESVGVVSRGNVHLRSISMNSPLTLELVTTGAGGAGVISAVVYLFRNPDKIGSWFPRLQASWYNGRAEAEKARRAYEKLRKARTRMRELDR
ncbi:hypothetical protein [Nonomuraea rubra]|uniref:Uncharacterized protein n=1 Tax=Nonomuraea rubra TaxID=46180 RepID=A0A7X0NLV5_9ACTN|nr:hypothetical protein [Nonomuraea rubra]MBB6545859.1 hypothetical protein [Nonomuraea rubra]